MNEFTNGELKLIFQRFEEKLDDLKQSMETRTDRYESEVLSLKTDIKETDAKVDALDRSITKIFAIGGTIWSALTLFGGFLLNKFF